MRLPTFLFGLTLLVLSCAGTRAEPALDPIVESFINGLKAQNFPPLNTRNPEEARDVLERLQGLPIAFAPTDEHSRFVAGGPSARTHVHIVRPKGVTDALPAIIYLHGGGWMMGSFKTHERLVRALAHGVGATVVFVDYYRTPEARAPIPMEQSYAVLKYVSEHPVELNIDPSRLAVAGDGAGGGMATALTMLAKKRGGPTIKSQVLLYPLTSAKFDDASYKEFADGPWLGRDDMKWFWEFYMPDRSARSETTASPLLADIDDLRDLPPALIITAEHDVLRDQGEAYGNLLAAAGVPTKQTRYRGVIHDFMMLNVFADILPARMALQQAIDELAIRLKKP